ncbi:MAG: 23S rRNA (adenine(2503)-C(2))-methyltransferase RlmN [Polyangiaceae bacterium]
MSDRPLAPHPIARSPEDWAAVLTTLGERPFRAKEVFRWIHQRNALDPEAMTSLPRGLRQSLFQVNGEPARSAGTLTTSHRSADDTRKLLIGLHDGATIESVLIPRVSGPGKMTGNPLDAAASSSADDDDDDAEPVEGSPGKTEPAIRVTQCVSTQVGCAMGCGFCASGVAGLKRHLGPEEIVAQVLIARATLDPGEALRNVVYMGMGEPLHNYEATKRSLELLTHPDGIGLSKRRVTVSTSGLVPEIARLGADFGGQIALAISLHAADDETRSTLMPINRKYPLAELIAALRAYPLAPRRRITIEYTLVAGRNDSDQAARALSRLLRPLRVKINLIPMNPITGSSETGPGADRVFAFQSILTNEGYSCFIRRQRGDDVAAACGQLALAGERRKVRSLLGR